MGDDQKMRPPYYLWWRTWTEEGRPYAAMFRELSASVSKHKHAADAGFKWAVGKDQPHVSNLIYVAPDYRESVASNISGSEDGSGLWRDAASGQDWRGTIRVGTEPTFEMPF